MRSTTLLVVVAGTSASASFDSNAYEKGIKVSDEEMVSLIAPRRPDG